VLQCNITAKLEKSNRDGKADKPNSGDDLKITIHPSAQIGRRRKILNDVTK
jgi:hypothetical protein